MRSQSDLVFGMGIYDHSRLDRALLYIESIGLLFTETDFRSVVYPSYIAIDEIDAAPACTCATGDDCPCEVCLAEWSKAWVLP